MFTACSWIFTTERQTPMSFNQVTHKFLGCAAFNWYRNPTTGVTAEKFNIPGAPAPGTAIPDISVSTLGIWGRDDAYVTKEWYASKEISSSCLLESSTICADTTCMRHEFHHHACTKFLAIRTALLTTSPCCCRRMQASAR